MFKYNNEIRSKVVKIKEGILQYTFLIKPFLILFGVYVISISAILRANINYIDDIGRINLGYKGWEDFGRYFSNFLSTWIHADTYLTDISPFSQIIAIVFLSISGVILLHVITEKKQFSILEIISAIPLGLSPYFLECISYKFDSPYMALSILASIIPILFYKKGYIKYTITVIAGILIVCTTYQASSGIFPMVVILLCLKNWNSKENNKELLKFIISSIIGYITGLIIFKVFIMQSIEPDKYVSTAMAPVNEMFSTIITNFKMYFSLLKSDLKKEWLILICLIAIGFIFNMVNNSKHKKCQSFLIVIITLLLMLLVMFGTYPLLVKPSQSPRAMYGVGAFITLMGICCCSLKKAYLFKILYFILTWNFIIFAFTYGNALNVQNEYTNFRILMVINDLNNLNILASKEKIEVEISGSIGLAPSIKNIPKDYNILTRLIPINFRGNWYWGTYKFYNYNNLKKVIKKSSVDLKNYNLPILKENIYHTIKGNVKYIRIELK